MDVMANLKDIIRWNAVKKMFDWTPIAVSVPQPRYEEYSDTGRVLLGYEVRVTYLHHGEHTRLFVTLDNSGRVGRRRALYHAIKYYKNTRDRARCALNPEYQK